MYYLVFVWLSVESVSGSEPLVMLSRWGRCLASGHCCCPHIVIISLSSPRSHDLSSAWPHWAPASLPARDGRVLARSGCSTLNYHHHWSLDTGHLPWLVSTRLCMEQLASSINTNGAMKIKSLGLSSFFNSSNHYHKSLFCKYTELRITRGECLTKS